ncbi:riboflavin synthase [Candidatus Aerophobetes bacterium]|nr:riboflavin synthase [Candidatus Aerophobetes bacterium]
MFTGIIEEMGVVEKVEIKSSLHRLRIKAEKVLEGTGVSDSLAVNGVCLTVIEVEKRCFTVQIMPHTLNKSNLRGVKEGDKINLERAVSLNERLGGHLVTGDIDGVGIINYIRRERGQNIWGIKFPSLLSKYIVPQGRVTLEGVSLTVAGVEKEGFTICLTPFTLENTTLGLKKRGDLLNLEVDILSKYVEKILSSPEKISIEFLKNAGY